MTGALVSPRDIPGYADAIARLIEDDEARRAAGVASHARAAGYQWDAINQVVLDTYLNVVDRKR